VPTNWTTPDTNQWVLHQRGPQRQIIKLPSDLPYLGSYSSLEERIFARELLKRNIPFHAQVSHGFGRQAQGGIVSDFEIPGIGTVEIVGEYWHSFQPAEDEKQVYYAALNKRLIRIWSNDILHRLDWVMTTMVGMRL
jgi:hypothetical protein